MVDRASSRIESESFPHDDLAGPGDDGCKPSAPSPDAWEWQSLFAAAGFSMLDAPRLDGPEFVHLHVSAEDAPRVSRIVLHRVPVSVFELAHKPIELDAAPGRVHAATTARHIVRTGDLVRCINVPIEETAEWLETERQRRARQKPPRPPRQRFKVKGSRNWQDAAPAAVRESAHPNAEKPVSHQAVAGDECAPAALISAHFAAQNCAAG